MFCAGATTAGRMRRSERTSMLEVRDGQAYFNTSQHDATEKAVLSQSGKFKGEDVVRICLEQKSCPDFIAGKLFRFLVSETVPL